MELRNDTVIKGQLDAADEDMNLTLSGASWQPLQGEPQRMDFFYVRGTSVRWAPALSLLLLSGAAVGSCLHRSYSLSCHLPPAAAYHT